MGAIQQAALARGYTLGQIKKANEDAWDTQPEGFSNTIRWNVGHIYVSTEEFLSQALDQYEPSHGDWFSFFKSGSSPSTWQDTPPSAEDLVVALKEQGKRIPQVVEGQLDRVLESPISIGKLLTMNTVDEVLQFIAWHEGIHAGVIDGLARITK
ncbi:DinB family protein [Sporosarcina obsidiansis]|uniref:DinB family protein n=1 Tax=Sporosarcina obsidiansis TaxID=2660748 RepID=UPI00129A8B92|nr:DinB family protein [Sporosarcina obsidiansis]